MDLTSLDTRKQILKDIGSEENKQRKAKSLRDFEVFQGRMHEYVIDYLSGQFAKSTVREMPIISSINLCKRIVNKESSIYVGEPERSFTNVNDEQLKNIQDIYKDISFNSKMLKANKVYKLQNQSLMMIVPVDGEIKVRVLYAHQYDVIPSDNDPEVAEGYIVNIFDKQDYLPQSGVGSNLKNAEIGSRNFRDNINQKIADADDYKKGLERYLVWTKELNFIMDGNGKIISEDVISPLSDYGIMPFIDIADDKDFEYFVRNDDGVVDFTVQYNGALSDLANVVKMQGWGQAYLKGDKDLMPESIVVGINHILRLPVDPNNKVDTEFGFVTPNANIDGSIKYIEMLLSNYLSSKGLDTSIISSNGASEKFTSGIERLLSQIEKFEASKSDFAIFKKAEIQAFEIIKAWTNVLSGEIKYETIPEDAEISIMFHEPQMIQSRSEKVDSLAKEVELGFRSRIDAIKELHDVDNEKAKEIIKEIDQSTMGVLDGSQSAGSQTN